jgi:hypothetical protein
LVLSDLDPFLVAAEQAADGTKEAMRVDPDQEYTYLLHDVVRMQNLGAFTGTFDTSLPAYGSMVLKVSRKATALPAPAGRE